MFRSDRILTLNIGASRLVMGEFISLKEGGLELVNYATAPLGLDPDAEVDPSAYIVSAIHDILKSSGIRPGPVALSISGQMVFPRYVKLPPVSKDKIAQIVRYEAQQNVPFPIEEVVWDYQLIGEEGGELSVMLVAVKSELVKNLTDCVEAAGLDPLLVDVSPMALYNAVRFNYADLDGCTMILDIGARSTNVVFVEGPRVFSRSIPVAGHSITKDLMKDFGLSFEDAEALKQAHAFVGFGGNYEGGETGVAERSSKIVRSMMTRLHAEISRTVNFYRSQQGGSAPTNVLLAGGSSVIPHTDTFLKEKLKVPVDYLNPFRNVAVSEAIPADRIGKDLPVLGEVVGLALRRTLSCPVEINLMPTALVARRTFLRRLPFLAVACLGLVLTLGVWWLYVNRVHRSFVERLSKVQNRVTELSRVDAELKTIEQAKQSVEAQLEDLSRLVGARTQVLTMLQLVEEKMPDGMWIIAFRPPAGGATGRLELRGMAFVDKVSNEAIGDFAARLKGLGPFGDEIDIKSIRQVPDADYLREFTIEIPLKGAVPAT